MNSTLFHIFGTPISILSVKILVWDLSFFFGGVQDYKAKDVDLSVYKGKVLLVVNVASKWFFPLFSLCLICSLFWVWTENCYRSKFLISGSFGIVCGVVTVGLPIRITPNWLSSTTNTRTEVDDSCQIHFSLDDFCEILFVYLLRRGFVMYPWWEIYGFFCFLEMLGNSCREFRSVFLLYRTPMMGFNFFLLLYVELINTCWELYHNIILCDRHDGFWLFSPSFMWNYEISRKKFML